MTARSREETILQFAMFMQARDARPNGDYTGVSWDMLHALGGQAEYLKDAEAYLAAVEVLGYGPVGDIQTRWSEGNPNDGVYEYVETGDCDGTFINRYRRTPHRELHIPAGPWQRTEAPMPPFNEPDEEMGQ